MTDILNLFRKGFLAGVFIGLGGFAFLSVDNKILGSILFSFGLIAVVLLNQKLYTGLIGYIEFNSGHLYASIILLGNIIGSSTFGLLCTSLIKDKAITVIENKLNNSSSETFIKSIICGMLIFLAVELFRRYQDLICLTFPVIIFILTNAEHCIANIFYFYASFTFNIKFIPFIFICILGNSIGAIIVRRILKDLDEDEHQDEDEKNNEECCD